MTDQQTPTNTGHGADDGRHLPDFLSRWVAEQRWFPSHAALPTLVIVAEWPLPSADLDVRLRTLLVRDTFSSQAVLFHIPLTEYRQRQPHLAPALIAVDQNTATDHPFVYDGTHDSAWVSALLRFIVEGETYPAANDLSADMVARGEPCVTVSPARSLANRVRTASVLSSHVLNGEQSNTSIICELAAGNRVVSPVICKLFRAVYPGQNPDVVVQSALATAGSVFIPEPVGAVTGQWRDPHQPNERVSGHLVFVQEFLPNVADAWRTALEAATAGQDFSEPARRLGEATAGIHADLAAVLPTRVATPRLMVSMVTLMLDRFRAAMIEVPPLRAMRTEVESMFARALTVSWPRLQRIHGDFHLGQVLDVPERGWILLDFEGEPLRPVAERNEPDVPLRDVAGILRSFDYVAGTVTQADPHRDPNDILEWSATCRRAFLAGYLAGISTGESSASSAPRSSTLFVYPGDYLEHNPLLEALELDKAIYETVYETRNRPTWLPLPLAAVRRMTSAHARSLDDQD
ncbi:phosphotransferase [Cryobacterium sp. CG_9.6]|uniref:maltokinase N-terminal cap-like domain-containing protein n=1 Tax=Cryobacterium sp. CG_9.6 TaxID=2760710 RepID=UPI0024737A87|nr:phosphotransferase [Cryobacterium sp. CG_9.6]MDH6236829.1 trehalose synthase-fused probable maltokinase [Cryobacterium sp. CG_9.6]